MKAGRLTTISILLFFAGLAARLPNWGRSGLSFEECIVAYRVSDFSTVFSQNDGNLWFYPFLVWLFSSVFGSSETALRLPSLLAGAALGPAIFLILRQRWSGAAALFPAAMATLNPLSLSYSQEARGYSLAMFLSLLWFGLLWRLLYPEPEASRPKPLVAAFVVTSLMLAVSHHYCLCVLLSGAVLASVRLFCEPSLRRDALRPLLAGLGSALGIWLLSTMLATRSGTSTGSFNPAVSIMDLDKLLRMTLASSLSAVGNYDWVGLTGVFVIASLAGLALGRPSTSPEWAWGAQPLLCLVFVVLGRSVLGDFASLGDESVFLGIILVSLGLGVSKIFNPVVRAVAMALLLTSQVYACLGVYQLAAPKSNSREMAELIRSQEPDLLIATLPEGHNPRYHMPMTYYLHQRFGTDIPIVETPSFEVVPDGFLSAADYQARYSEFLAVPQNEVQEKLRAALEGHRTVVVIGQEPELRALESVLKDYSVSRAENFSSLTEGNTIVVTFQTPATESGE